MNERLKEEPAEIEKGCLVKIVDKGVYEAVTAIEKPSAENAFRVLDISPPSDFRIIYLSANTINPRNIEDFDASNENWLEDERYSDVFAVPMYAVRRILHS